jgi:hypothetical protein
MRRILILNNYSFDRVQEEIRRGDKPDHHLYGINHFSAAGYEVDIIPYSNDSSWHTFQNCLGKVRFPIPLGNLDRQVQAWQRRGGVDLIYAPCQTETQILGYLRYLGWNRVPMVCLAHHPFETGRMARFRRPMLRANILGTDRYPSLSKGVATELNHLAGRAISEAIPWGPQEDYYEIAEGPGEGVVAAGRTGRDFDTFGLAATQAGMRSRIICLQSSVKPSFRQFGSNVEVEAHPDERPIGYRELMREFASARVLAIPMYSGTNLAGLTSLTDALGIGRPVIVTRNAYLDLDVEALGIGRWVEPGDVAGWADALRWFDTHPREAVEMGRRARALVDGGVNSRSFARRMMGIFDEVLDEERRR